MSSEAGSTGSQRYLEQGAYNVMLTHWRGKPHAHVRSRRESEGGKTHTRSSIHNRATVACAYLPGGTNTPGIALKGASRASIATGLGETPTRTQLGPLYKRRVPRTRESKGYVGDG